MKIWVIGSVMTGMVLLAVAMADEFFATRENVEDLIAVVQDPFSPLDVRARAVQALGETRDERQIPLMIDLLKGNDPTPLKFLAIRNLVTVQPNVPPELLPPSEHVFTRNERRYVQSWLIWWEREGKDRFMFATAW